MHQPTVLCLLGKISWSEVRDPAYTPWPQSKFATNTNKYTFLSTLCLKDILGDQKLIYNNSRMFNNDRIIQTGDLLNIVCLCPHYTKLAITWNAGLVSLPSATRLFFEGSVIHIQLDWLPENFCVSFRNRNKFLSLQPAGDVRQPLTRLYLKHRARLSWKRFFEMQ